VQGNTRGGAITLTLQGERSSEPRQLLKMTYQAGAIRQNCNSENYATKTFRAGLFSKLS